MDLQTLVISILCGGGAGFAVGKGFLKYEAKEAVKDEIKELKDNDADLHTRITKVEGDYVTCKYCTMQHTNQDKNFESINNKLDILINNATRQN